MSEAADGANAGMAPLPADHASRRSNDHGVLVGPERPPGHNSDAGEASSEHAEDAAQEKRSASTSETSDASTRPMRTALAVRDETTS